MPDQQPVSEGDLAVRGFEFSIAFEDGQWRAIAWQMIEIDLETNAPVLQERLAVLGETPLAAFAALYATLTGEEAHRGQQ